MQRIILADFLPLVSTDLKHWANSVALRKRRVWREGGDRQEQDGRHFWVWNVWEALTAQEKH